jgi:hypothetical protein
MDAIDLSYIVIETVFAHAVKETLPIHTYQCDFATFVLLLDVYSVF